MISRYTLVGLLATLACGAALAGEPSATAPKGVQKAAGGASHAKSAQKAAGRASQAIEEIVVQARAPEPMPVAPRPEIEAPRFVPPPLTITVPEVSGPSSGKQERLADAGTESKL